jgi:dTDP-4-amino-4,6-dideoxygalactose transaminase
MERYQETLDRRQEICERYSAQLIQNPIFELPQFETENAKSCYHLYQLRIKEATEAQRDEVIRLLAEKGISTNVHFQPLPLFSFYKKLGYEMKDYPNAWNFYQNEISLPVYFDLSFDDVDFICECIQEAVKAVL